MAEHHNGATSGEELVRSLYEEVESQTASALEQLVAKPSFGRLLAISGENVAALSRIGSDAADLVLRNFRIAGRADITRLARQLHRTEDKLERVLQEVEGLRDQLARKNTSDPGAPVSQNSGQRGGRRSAVKRP